ncbi:MAG: DUF1631 domain-containing protein [Betaproteobacteria bacterium]|nr:DUF1631 domain-containing protein [Betaproteobacteria bacterium]
MSAFQSLHAGNSTPETRARAQRLVRAMVGKTLGYFEERDTEQIKHLRGHLLDLADGKVPMMHGQNLRAASMLLDRQSERFLKNYRLELQRSLYEDIAQVWPGMSQLSAPVQAQGQTLDGMSLSLIDVDEVHRILLLDRVAQRFNNRFEPLLTALSTKLAALVGNETVSLSENPFRPLVLLKGFMLGWETSALDPQVTEHLVDALEPGHFIDLAPLYADLNSMLTQAGVQATTVHRIRKAPSSPSNLAPLSSPAPLGAAHQATQTGTQVQGSPVAAGPTAGSGAGAVVTTNSGNRPAWAALAPTGQQIVQQVRNFLHRLGVGRAPAAGAEGFEMSGEDGDGPGHGSSIAIPADPALLQYLGAMQAGAGRGSQFQFLQNDQPEGEPAPHRNVLRQLRAQPAFQDAQELDRGTVDALAEVFDYVFADGAIPAELKVIIGRLQIPVLRAAMMDRDFFLSTEHPARKLVDTLASASVTWTPEKGEQDPLYLRIESTVHRVLLEFDDDLELFSVLLAEFTEFLFECEQQVDIHIEPVTQKENNQEQLNAALAHADEIVHARITALPAHLPLAPFLKPFLAMQWRQVIALAWMTEDSHAGHWNHTLDIMDQLIWSTQPKTTSEERQKLVALLPELVRTLNTELDSIHWEGEDRGNFTRRLIATHMLAIRMKAAAPLDTQGAALEESAGEEAMQALDERRAIKLAEQDQSQMDEFDANAQLLTRGVWFEKVSPDTPPFRCRLSWVSPMRTRFLFTNREGFDAFVLSEREVAAMLRRQELQMLDQAPIVERALNRLMADNEPELRLQA